VLLLLLHHQCAVGEGEGGWLLHCNEKQRSNRLFYGLLLGDFIHIAAELAIHMLCYICSINWIRICKLPMLVLCCYVFI
jgi:hypothetical protein